MTNRSRQQKLQALKDNGSPTVLIVGGGINGIGVFRDLCAQGIDCVLIERGDYCSGASAALSRMIHGGLRYMENGEFQLVREALLERNRLLKNAPHYVRPLKTTIPIFDYVSGLLNAPLKFLRISNKPTRRGALIVKMGLTLYDIFTRTNRVMPTHSFHSKASTFGRWPDLNKEVKCSASYYDAWITYPERLGLELIEQAEAGNSQALALNYAEVESSDGKTLTIRDIDSGEAIPIQPQLVINATGAWLDLTNKALSDPQSEAKKRLVGGTKGSHLILRNRQLLDLLGDQMIYYENQEGRICIMFPYFGNVLIGSTDLRVDDPDAVRCEAAEIDYILQSLAFVFPDIAIRDEEIVFVFSGVRPLPFSEANVTGQISRDHYTRSFPGQNPGDFDTICMIGGKWTTYRAFGEQVTDQILGRLDRPRVHSTKNEAIGGGVNYPQSQADETRWLQALEKETGLPTNRLAVLFSRYGTKAADVARFCVRETDAPLIHAPDFTQREIHYLLQEESVVRLEDLLLRRTAMAIGGTLTLDLIEELLTIMAANLGWSTEKTEQERNHCLDRLAHFNGLTSERLTQCPTA